MLDPVPGEATGTSPQTAASSQTWLARALAPDSKSRRLIAAGLLYLVTTVVFAAFAGRDRLTEHTPYNHFALLADAWLHGRQDLAHGPPAYAMNNDFAEFQGKTFISFPPFPRC
jgi:hypothetical protein